PRRSRARLDCGRPAPGARPGVPSLPGGPGQSVRPRSALARAPRGAGERPPGGRAAPQAVPRPPRRPLARGAPTREGVMRVVVVGAGGHARSVIEALRTAGELEPVGCTDPRSEEHTSELQSLAYLV